MRKMIAESGKGKKGNERWKMERVGNWLFIALLMLWKIERKWKPCRKKVKEKGALGGNSVEQARNKPGRRSPKVEE